jgi:D-beta-D-heptose 7-phosphate kinase / D-beta-D-heptose 1-phosphate adenosyltransferase
VVADMPIAENDDLAGLIGRLQGARVMCIGDVMLDHYVYGRVELASPEAPVPVLTIDREMKSLGGAGNVLRNLVAFGVQASFISVIGSDDAGREIGRLLEAEEGAEVHVLVQPERTTTVKTRYVAANRTLLRADRETAAPLDPFCREDLLRLARELATGQSAIIVSDYAKGVLTEGVALEIIHAAHDAGVQVVVDPKGGDPIRYRGADLAKPNRTELAQATGMPVTTEREIAAAARILIERCDFGAVLVPLGAEGMILIEADGRVNVQRGIAPAVGDGLGMGDTVAAMLGAALAAGISAADGARLANIAAGIVAGKHGTAVVEPGELAGWIAGSALALENVMPGLTAAAIAQTGSA